MNPFALVALATWTLAAIGLIALAITDRPHPLTLLAAGPLCWLLGYMPWWYMAGQWGGV